MKTIVIAVCLLFCLASAANATGAKTTTIHRTKHGKKNKKTAKPTLLDRKKAIITQEDLSYLSDDQAQLLIESHALDPIVSTDHLVLDEGVNPYVRKWVLKPLNAFAEAYYRKFKRPIKVTSALRTLERQKELREKENNKNATLLSPHSTGATVDISHLHADAKEMKWVSNYWAPFVRRGEVVFTVERHRQACWDIFFSKPRVKPAPKVSAKAKSAKPHPIRKKRVRVILTWSGAVRFMINDAQPRKNWLSYELTVDA